MSWENIQGGLCSMFTAPRFDWYQVTFFEDVDPFKVIESAYLHFSEPGEDVQCHIVNPEVKQYKRGINAFVRGEKLFHLCIGGSGGDRPHIRSTGSNSHKVYEWLQKDWAGCFGVARADICLDSVEPGMFHTLNEDARKFKEDRKMKGHTAGDWDTPIAHGDGKTRYLGSVHGQGFVRIYEKGLQLKGNPNWVRLEFQVRPNKSEAKRLAGGFTPLEFIHSVPWCGSFMLGAMRGFDLVGASYQSIGTTWQPSRVERSLIACVKQYGRSLDELAASLPGGWGDVGNALKAIHDIHKETKGARGGMGLNPYSDLISQLLSDAA